MAAIAPRLFEVVRVRAERQAMERAAMDRAAEKRAEEIASSRFAERRYGARRFAPITECDFRAIEATIIRSDDLGGGRVLHLAGRNGRLVEVIEYPEGWNDKEGTPQ